VALLRQMADGWHTVAPLGSCHRNTEHRTASKNRSRARINIGPRGSESTIGVYISVAQDSEEKGVHAHVQLELLNGAGIPIGVNKFRAAISAGIGRARVAQLVPSSSFTKEENKLFFLVRVKV